MEDKLYNENEQEDYCKCNGAYPIYSDVDSTEFGYFERCTNCNKKIDGELHYYNHYDGEDHDYIDEY